jgi:signal peptidase I
MQAEQDATVRNEPAGGASSVQAHWGLRIAQTALRALWNVVIPALLVAVVLRYLLPGSGTGIPGAFADVGRQHTVVFGAGLFLAFSGLLRYWRFWMPGGRYASTLPAHIALGAKGAELREWADLAELLDRVRSRRALDRDPAHAVDGVDRLSAGLRDALQSGDLVEARAAATALRVSAQPVLRARRRRDAIVTMLTMGAAGVAALVLRSIVVQPYRVLSGSMLPTFEPDDVIGGNLLGRGGATGQGPLPHRGDVLVFQSSAVALGEGNWPGQLVKRVIGLPGDRITMEGGLPRINDWTVPSCDAGRYVYILPDAAGGAIFGHVRVEFLDDEAYLTLNAVPVAPFEATYVVQPGEVFVLGDNRNNSLDSRAWNQGRGGGVPLSAVDARARWFLVGRHRSGEVDLGRLFRGIDSLQVQVRVEGIDGSEVEAGVARCLANRPTATHPPAGGQASASSTSPTSGT